VVRAQADRGRSRVMASLRSPSVSPTMPSIPGVLPPGWALTFLTARARASHVPTHVDCTRRTRSKSFACPAFGIAL